MALTFGTSTRFALRWLKGENLVSDVDEGFKALAEDCDSKLLGYSQGTFASRPAAGTANRIYKATDGTAGVYHDTGTAWEPLLHTLIAGGGSVAFGLFTPAGGFDSAAGRSRRADSIPHGLGTTPVVALVSSCPIAITENGGSPQEAVACSVSTVDATNINVVSTAPGTTNNGTKVYWLAIA